MLYNICVDVCLFSLNYLFERYLHRYGFLIAAEVLISSALTRRLLLHKVPLRRYFEQTQEKLCVASCLKVSSCFRHNFDLSLRRSH